MNAGRDVERLIAGWLIEEAPTRAPDRILDSAAKVIDRTKQRRFGAAWRVPTWVASHGLAPAAAIGVGVVALGLIALNLASINRVGGLDPAASMTPAAALIKDGSYVGPTLRVADIVASINANPTLSDVDRRDVLENVLGVGDSQTFVVSIDILELEIEGRDTRQWIVRHTVDGVTRADVATGCHFEGDRLVVGGFFLAIDAFDVVTTGDGFTLSALQSQAADAEEAAAQVMFESGPFTPVR